MKNFIGRLYVALTVGLTALFCLLRGYGYIDWGWWACTAPVWASLIISLAACGIALFMMQIEKDDEFR